MDFITGVPCTNSGNDTILVIVDRLTNRAHLIPIVLKITAQQLAELFVEQFVKLHDLPMDIVSDRDSYLPFHGLGSVCNNYRRKTGDGVGPPPANEGSS